MATVPRKMAPKPSPNPKTVPWDTPTKGLLWMQARTIPLKTLRGAYRGVLLTRNSPPPPRTSLGPQAWSYCRVLAGRVVSYGRGTPVYPGKDVPFSTQIEQKDAGPSPCSLLNEPRPLMPKPLTPTPDSGHATPRVRETRLQGYLAHKKQRFPRTLQ